MSTCNSCKHWQGHLVKTPDGYEHRTFEGYAPCGVLGRYGKALMAGTWQENGGTVSTQSYFGCNAWETLVSESEGDSMRMDDIERVNIAPETITVTCRMNGATASHFTNGRQYIASKEPGKEHCDTWVIKDDIGYDRVILVNQKSPHLMRYWPVEGNPYAMDQECVGVFEYAPNEQRRVTC